ncbi:MarR family winged helix-turn-helix transcriptional regulator [Streptomyces sp. NBC_00083]|uniref:MarR family winged helix-turn-helix transcriptional regulator n=1 Tax=Streptomyces sp. NBC_00083 TaxID=2975647 RepID=UPI0022534143|nr:MarR family winged helix-turn-helix transcriptional regulator [Streptomyces sp. NBC_00083]MCX5384698.1 MarR family winged helix-turn-helix transcriptional regulator [Streptomyces sp. NBC_00083]
MQHQESNGPRQQALWMADRCLGRRIARLHRLVSRRFEAELRKSGLTLPQLEVLSEMAVSGEPVRPSEIAGWLGIERSTISRNLDLLAQLGYVSAAEVSATGRTTRVVVTDAGHQALMDAEPAWARAQEWISGAVDDDAIDALDRWLTALELAPRPH